VAPLKTNGQPVNDSKGKAEILIRQIKSVFTREQNIALPKTTKHSFGFPDLSFAFLLEVPVILPYFCFLCLFI
jgi:hypothetical protein